MIKYQMRRIAKGSHLDQWEWDACGYRGEITRLNSGRELFSATIDGSRNTGHGKRAYQAIESVIIRERKGRLEMEPSR